VNSVVRPKYISAVSMGADAVGQWLNVRGLSIMGFQAVWTGTPTGVWVVDVSYDGAAVNSSTRLEGPTGTLGVTPLTLTSAMIAAYPAGAAGNFVFEFDRMSCPWIRFWYDRTSGTGTLSVGFAG
jgi:hypothetical protein